MSRVLIFLLLGLGCGSGPQVEHARRMPGDANATPSMECLPAVEAELSSDMRFAWLLAEQTFELPAPPPAAEDARVTQVQEWTNQSLRPWLVRKVQMVEAARDALDARVDDGPRERVLAGALVGLMYEDVGRTLLRVPVPIDLQTEPEIAEVFMEVVRSEAGPYLEHARRAYRACQLNAGNRGAPQDFALFCSARGERLPLEVEIVPADGTVVEVIRE